MVGQGLVGPDCVGFFTSNTGSQHGLWVPSPTYGLTPQIRSATLHKSARAPRRKPYLEAGFPLRCFQRLSFPNVTNQPYPWQDNWHTRGSPHPTKISLLCSDISAGALSARPGPLVTQGQVFSSFLRAQHHTGWRTFGATETELTHGFLNLSIAYRFNGRTPGVPATIATGDFVE